MSVQFDSYSGDAVQQPSHSILQAVQKSDENRVQETVSPSIEGAAHFKTLENKGFSTKDWKATSKPIPPKREPLPKKTKDADEFYRFNPITNAWE